MGGSRRGLGLPAAPRHAMGQPHTPPCPAGAGPGSPDVVVTDPGGRRVEALLEGRGDGAFRCSYRPTAEGTHSVAVTFGGTPIPRSPFAVGVGQGERGAAPQVGPGAHPGEGGCPVAGWGLCPTSGGRPLSRGLSRSRLGSLPHK